MSISAVWLNPATEEKWSTAFLLFSIVARQALVTGLRKVGKGHVLHAHDSISLFPLAFSCLCCILALTNIVPTLHVNVLSDTHLGLVIGPQVLTWFWVLKTRSEFSKGDFSLHAFFFTLVVVLLMIHIDVGLVSSLCLSLALVVGSARRHPHQFRQRICVLWVCISLLCLLRLLGSSARGIELSGSRFVTSGLEVAMIFVLKFRFPQFFVFDARNGKDGEGKHNKSSTDVAHVNDNEDTEVNDDDLLAPLTPPLAPLELNRSDSQNSHSSLPPFHHHHRRDLSIQSNGSWAWGPVVVDFGKTLSPRDSQSSNSSSGDDEEDNLV